MKEKIYNINGNIRKDFPALTGELFDFFADYLFATDNIKKNAEIYHELKEVYFPGERKYFLKLNDCLKRYHGSRTEPQLWAYDVPCVLPDRYHDMVGVERQYAEPTKTRSPPYGKRNLHRHCTESLSG